MKSGLKLALLVVTAMTVAVIIYLAGLLLFGALMDLLPA